MAGDLTTLKASDFIPYLNQVMPIQFSHEATLPAELIEAKETETLANVERNPFHIIFRTEQKDRYYQQGIYRILHPDKGELDVFLVPLGPDAKGMLYEAVFS